MNTALGALGGMLVGIAAAKMWYAGDRKLAVITFVGGVLFVGFITA